MDTMTAPMNNTPELREVRKGTIRLVIADDHPIVRDGLKKLLLLEDDFEIVGEAGDGREVLDKVQELDPDVLLLDLRKVNAGEIWLDSHTTAAVMRQFQTGSEASGAPGSKGRERSPLSAREREIVA